jgi:hypothetical protein
MVPEWKFVLRAGSVRRSDKRKSKTRTQSRPAFDNRQIVNGFLSRIRSGGHGAIQGSPLAIADNSRHSLDSTTVRGHVSAAASPAALMEQVWDRSNRSVAPPAALMEQVWDRSHASTASPAALSDKLDRSQHLDRALSKIKNTGAAERQPRQRHYLGRSIGLIKKKSTGRNWRRLDL